MATIVIMNGPEIPESEKNLIAQLEQAVTQHTEQTAEQQAALVIAGDAEQYQPISS